MNTPNPVIYEFCRNAWERYRREEDLPVESLPSLVSPSDDVPGGGWLMRVVRRILAPRSRIGQQRPVSQGAVAK
jgi:hypothetical protein